LRPRENPADRAWHHFDLDLAAFGGKTVRLELRTDPAGKADYSSSYWAEPHLALATDPISGMRDNWVSEAKSGKADAA
jgi:hypothetical protein